MKKSVFAVLLLMFVCFAGNAQTFYRNGIAYNITISAQPLTVEVVSNVNEYFGVVEIPYQVPFRGQLYTVTRIADGAFQYCNSLTTVILPYSVNTIGDYAFSGCTSLNSIILPMTLLRIGQNAFAGSGLTSIMIPANVNEIGPGAFSDCTSLTSLQVVEGNIKYASVNNMLLTIDLTQLICCPAGLSGTVYVLNTVKQINFAAFQNCEMITAVVIPGTCNTIGAWAFQNCYELKIVQLNDGLKNIEAGAFDNCQVLDTLILPSTVQFIGNSAFRDCKALSVISLGDGLLRLGDRVFQDCDMLTRLTIPAKVNKVGSYLLKDCKNLKKITFLSPQPPEVHKHTFTTDATDFVVYVPASSIGLYKKAEHWDYLTNLEPIQ